MVAFSSVAVQGLLAFNLICTGQTTFKGEVHPFLNVIRVDLKSGRFCEQDCKLIKPLARVISTELVFEDRDADGVFWNMRYIRETGTYFSEVRMQVGSSEIARWDAGSCKRGAFTGFPATAKVKGQD
ncbi:hypothetical protein TPR58_22230 [Sphingomonas sp. HF-S3]|uniref:Uncharacterized protein n=1 Tax=Sphingomonas rustica TaxID=3103142 RepID=A0ABV0BHR7_9SPHN